VIRFRPAAAREFVADVRHYDKRYLHRGQRFVEAVERTLVRVAEAPLLSPVLYEPDIRSAKVGRFPYRVVYIIVQGDIDVIAVAHAKRRPEYWRRRLK
jgi:hypothetical protein